MGAILHHFKHTAELSVLIAYWYLYNIDEKTWLIYPKFGLILLSALQLIDYFANDMGAFAWVTVHYFTPNYILTAWENTMVGV